MALRRPFNTVNPGEYVPGHGLLVEILDRPRSPYGHLLCFEDGHGSSESVVWDDSR